VGRDKNVNNALYTAAVLKAYSGTTGHSTSTGKPACSGTSRRAWRYAPQAF